MYCKYCMLGDSKIGIVAGIYLPYYLQILAWTVHCICLCTKCTVFKYYKKSLRVDDRH